MNLEDFGLGAQVGSYQLRSAKTGNTEGVDLVILGLSLTCKVEVGPHEEDVDIQFMWAT